MCTVEKCDKSGKTVRGLCPMHYQRQRRGLDMNTEPRHTNKSECKNKKCNRDAFCLGFCRRCYNKFKTFGDPDFGKKLGENQKIKKRNSNGYIQYYYPDSPHASAHGWVYEHREVMGAIIGRPLLGHENVHHKNGDRADNRPENLELWSTSQPSGQRVEDKLKWAYEIIALYGKKFSA